MVFTINSEIQLRMNSDRFVADADNAFYSKIFFMDGRKSYCGLSYDLTSHSQSLVTKGVSYTKLNQ